MKWLTDLSWTCRLAFILGVLVLPLGAVAEEKNVIQFPEEELAAESVLPVFDQPATVKNRNVVTDGRFEIGAIGGYSLTEPLFNPFSLGGTASYHFNEDHGLNLMGIYFMPGQSDYSKQLNPIPGSNGVNANLQYAPAPKYLALASYQFTAFYGKLSLTKQTVMNLHLYGLLGGGAIGIGDVSNPVGSFGLGQKFYFNSHFALRFDLRFLVYQGPNPVSQKLDTQTQVQPASFFDQKTFFDSLLSFGAVFLIPGG